MEPEFKEGDIIVVSPNTVPGSGDYAVVGIEGEVTFKQLHIYLHRLVLKPLNDKYSPVEVKRDDGIQCRIIDKAVQKIKRH